MPSGTVPIPQPADLYPSEGGAGAVSRPVHRFGFPAPSVRPAISGGGAQSGAKRRYNCAAPPRQFFILVRLAPSEGSPYPFSRFSLPQGREKARSWFDWVLIQPAPVVIVRKKTPVYCPVISHCTGGVKTKPYGCGAVLTPPENFFRHRALQNRTSVLL